MVNELLAMKAKAEHDILYAQAKLEVVNELLEKVKPVEEPVEEVVVEEQPIQETEDVELESI